MAQKILELEQQLEQQTIQLKSVIDILIPRSQESCSLYAYHLYRKLTSMKQIAQQHDGKHDQMSTEYEELMTNPNIILGQLEEHFDDEFDAKGFLSDLFMVYTSIFTC